MSDLLVRPPRKFRFVVEGIMPANAMTDEQARYLICLVRNTLLIQMANQLVAVPTDAMLKEIELFPHIGAHQ